MEKKTYYRFLTDDETKQSFSNDYLVSENAVKKIGEINFKKAIISETEKSTFDEQNNPYDSIGGLRTYMYNIGLEYNPRYIKEALLLLKEHNGNFSKALVQVDSTLTKVLTRLQASYRNNTTADWIKTYNTLVLNEEEAKKCDFLKQNNFRVLRVFGNPKGFIDDYNGDLSAIMSDGVYTYFYNHVTPNRFEIVENIDNKGVGGHVQFVDPAIIDFNILNGFDNTDDPKSILEISGRVINMLKENGNFPQHILDCMIILITSYYCANDANYYTLMHLASIYNVKLADLIIAKELLINAVISFINNPDLSYSFENNFRPYGKTGIAKTLERDYFSEYFVK